MSIQDYDRWALSSIFRLVLTFAIDLRPGPDVFVGQPVHAPRRTMRAGSTSAAGVRQRPPIASAGAIVRGFPVTRPTHEAVDDA